MGVVLWFTGLSGSGKSSVAGLLAERLTAAGKKVALIDGDAVRRTLHRHLGFTREDIRENNRLVAELAKKEASRADVVLVPIISPFREDRAMARRIVGDGFFELYLNCPLEYCIARDAKGLYREALAGRRAPLIGMEGGIPYEPPENPDIEVRTHEQTSEEAVEKILASLERSAP